MVQHVLLYVPGRLRLRQRATSRSPTLTSEGVNNYDFAVMKSTNISERANVQFRAEFFNIFNRVQFAPPVGQQGSSNFGEILSQVNQPREIQFSLRVNF